MTVTARIKAGLHVAPDSGGAQYSHPVKQVYRSLSIRAIITSPRENVGLMVDNHTPRG